MSELSTTRGLRRRKRLVVAIAVAAFLGVGAAGTYVAVSPESAATGGIGCYDRAELGANVTIVSADGRDPVAICESLWAQGVVASGTIQAPPLVACALKGAVGVFPGDGTSLCTRLGLQPLPVGYHEAARRVAAVRDELVAAFGGRGCVAPTEAESLARAALARHGLAGWDVERTGPFTPERPCATLGFDGGRRAVLLIPFDTSGGVPLP